MGVPGRARGRAAFGATATFFLVVGPRGFTITPNKLRRHQKDSHGAAPCVQRARTQPGRQVKDLPRDPLRALQTGSSTGDPWALPGPSDSRPPVSS